MRTIGMAITAIWLAAAAFGQVPVVGEDGLSLKDLVKSQKLVTAVLSKSDAEDPNLRVVEVTDDWVILESPLAETRVYLFDALKEIRVQDGKVAVTKTDHEAQRRLRAREEPIVTRAFDRAAEVFKYAGGNQPLRMRGAVLLALKDDEEALGYLRQLADGNDPGTQLAGVACLYLAGDAENRESVIMKGIESGNHKVKALAAQLAGLLGVHEAEPILLQMLQRRTADLSVPAARALARLGNRESIPTLLEMINTEDRGEAAVFALSRLGGQDIVEQMKILLERTTMMPRYRVIRVLHALKSPLGSQLLRDESMKMPTLELESALILAREGDWEAMDILRARLRSRYNPEEETLKNRARAAAAMLEGGHSPSIADLQRLLQLTEVDVLGLTKAKPVDRKLVINNVAIKVCELIAALGRLDMLSLLQPVIESGDPRVALAACEAAVALTDVEFRQRLVQVQQDQ
ncbi:MAG TPA: HEAT repeat domain-containing protein [Candidatus Hydrogenedentes bacterium]|nr:HEAT repeat domain-containing protein [Candidatus Hydrogenedentota bacterium]HIJ73819.1 HEAT repeat domain-containing protein [Candidatus Hydrogenedentota bacterium]